MTNILSQKELRRYNRHIILDKIGIEGQQKLKNAKVLIVGAGGLGTPVMQYLSAAGVGKLGIADKDVVEESNLARQIIYSDNNIGKLKTVVAKEKLQYQNKNTEIQIYNLYISKKNALRIISEYDLVIDCTDNLPTRYLLSDACVILNKPLVYGSVYKFEGQVSVLNYKGGATYRCLFPKQDNRKVVKASEAGIFGILPGIIGTFQASEAIKIITEIGTVLHDRLYVINSLNMQTYFIKTKPLAENKNIKELGEYDDF